MKGVKMNTVCTITDEALYRVIMEDGERLQAASTDTEAGIVHYYLISYEGKLYAVNKRDEYVVFCNRLN